MRRATVPAVIALLAVGCATMSGHRPNEDDRFRTGMQAYASGNYATARTEFAWLAEHFANEPVGQRALLVLAAVQMDPRNPNRQADDGSDLAARFLQRPERDAWVDPVAQTLYLLGVELGVAEEREREVQQQLQQTRALPKLPGPTVTARIKAIEGERDKLAKRVTTLEEQLAQKDRELERIRKTIKP